MLLSGIMSYKEPCKEKYVEIVKEFEKCNYVRSADVGAAFNFLQIEWLKLHFQGNAPDLSYSIISKEKKLAYTPKEWNLLSEGGKVHIFINSFRIIKLIYSLGKGFQYLESPGRKIQIKVINKRGFIGYAYQVDDTICYGPVNNMTSLEDNYLSIIRQILIETKFRPLIFMFDNVDVAVIIQDLIPYRKNKFPNSPWQNQDGRYFHNYHLVGGISEMLTPDVIIQYVEKVDDHVLDRAISGSRNKMNTVEKLKE